MDEMQWDYVGYSRQHFVDSVLKATEEMGLYCEHLADFDGMAIFFMGKIGTYNDTVMEFLKRIGPFDSIYYQIDSDAVLHKFDMNFFKDKRNKEAGEKGKQ